MEMGQNVLLKQCAEGKNMFDKVSVLIPAYNEQDSLIELYNKVVNSLKAGGGGYYGFRVWVFP